MIWFSVGRVVGLDDPIYVAAIVLHINPQLWWLIA